MKIKTKSETLALLTTLYDMPRPRARKCETLYDLAKSVTKGVIVELGTFHATGAIALWHGSAAGALATVYTIDDYAERKGWASEPYGPEDQKIAVENTRKAGCFPRNDWRDYLGRPFFAMIRNNARDIASEENWIAQVGLLFWDLGMMSRVENDLEAWLPHIIPGGIIALHDTADGKLGCADVLRAQGLDYELMPGGVLVAGKP
jgi:predicted O-methyltransferase YrrM